MGATPTVSFVWFCLFLLWPNPAVAEGGSNCSCGYVDASSGQLYTDSIIVYFNETTSLPSNDFLAESYTNKYEQGWNSVFRQGADPANVAIGNDSSTASNTTSSLQLVVSPATEDHVVVGGGIRTQRQDILYGTFRAMLRSPPANSGGSSLSMMLQYNRTSRITANLQNGDWPQHAWLSTLMNGEFPDLDLGVNYTNLSRPERPYGALRPWDYNEIKMDWTPDSINYFIGGHPLRMVNGSANDGTKRPNTPSPFTLKHWSVGDLYAMYGPPTQAPVEASVAWARLFFNTSSMTKEKHADYDGVCNGVQACLVDDVTLRGSTEYPQEASQEWVSPDSGYTLRWWAIGIMSFCLSITVVVLLNILLKATLTTPPKPKREPAPEERRDTSNALVPASGTSTPLAFHHTPLVSGYVTPVTQPASPGSPRDPYGVGAGSFALGPPSFVNLTRAPSPARLPASMDHSRCHTGISETLSRHQSMTDILASQTPARISTDAMRTHAGTLQTRNRNQSVNDFLISQMPLPPPVCPNCHHCVQPHAHPQSGVGARTVSIMSQSRPHGLNSRTMSLMSEMSGMSAPSNRANSFLGRAVEGISYGPALPVEDLGRDEVARRGIPVSRTTTMVGSRTSTMMGPASPRPPGDENPPAPPARDPRRNTPAAAPARPRMRVDYLAGLTAVCSLLVSLTHFMLTFVPATIQPGAFAHYESEVWVSRSIGPFLFNEVWVVIFFTTSTRFLTTKYLRSGELGAIAEKVVGRVFRLMIPIAGVILLEYFLMDAGAVNWLQYLPSVSWSTWVYTSVFPHFGAFVNQTLQLVYLIPNAMPPITFNFCTGVLWTIPVQIQGSWQAMLGVVVIREIRTPWKRFGYYAASITLHWYARSWGSFFMAGLLLADLDITFKYRKWLHARPWVYYPALNLALLLALVALGSDLTASWTGFDFTTAEAGWHPSRATGQFLVQRGPVDFPAYYYPKLNGLVFAVGAQLVVEWSQWVQKVVSTKVFLWLFPHIFTIYLFHGFIFWSVGSWICVGLAAWGVPYWANVLVTAVGSYACLFACLPLVTPMVEVLGKTATASLWTAASETPPPKRATLFPFPRDLFTGRGGGSGASEDGSSVTAASRGSQEAARRAETEKREEAAMDEVLPSRVMTPPPGAREKKGLDVTLAAVPSSSDDVAPQRGTHGKGVGAMAEEAPSSEDVTSQTEGDKKAPDVP